MSTNYNCTNDTYIGQILQQIDQHQYFAGAFYLAAMIYVFIGIAIIADIFMNSIEYITSQTIQVKQQVGPSGEWKTVSVQLWNSTVANLTLMSFGSASPEILLATIEIVRNNFKADQLGPGTIVGASMFNTLVITAFCVIAVPKTAVKRIDNIKVFWTSTAFSLTAYIWLYLVLRVFTPNVITVAEACITILMFPLMVFIGYLADKNFCLPPSPLKHFLNVESNSNERMNEPTQVDVNHGPRTTSMTEEIESDSINYENQHPENDDVITVRKSDLTERWTEQIKCAFQVNSDMTNTSWYHYVGHYFCFFWKTTFALIPPDNWLGGWPTFVCSIVVIGLLTALMGDFATALGCSMNWEMHNTAITVVAIGTSLPDLFASRVAAQRERSADSAIGNINGSNAFNVFLGLGIPWLCASIYHQCNESNFIVSDLGDLAYSVQLFIIFSLLHLTVLTVRRNFLCMGSGELGGPRIYAWLCFVLFISLWLLYITLSLLH